MKKLTKKELQNLHENILETMKGEKFVEFLDQCLIASKYSYEYSFGNILLANFELMFRKGYGITMLAPFKRWSKQMNRKIKKGEKGLSILAPIIKRIPNKVTEIENEDGETETKVLEWEQRCVGFKTVKVFDYTQTEPRDETSFELPEIKTCFLKDTGEYDWLQTIIDDAKKNDIKVYLGDTGESNGYTDGSKIVLQKNNKPLEQFKTYIHERAHMLLHFDKNSNMRSSDIQMDKEIEAETATYFILKSLGFSKEELQGQINYLASWTYGEDFEMNNYFSNVQKALDEIKIAIVEKVKVAV